MYPNTRIYHGFNISRVISLPNNARFFFVSDITYLAVNISLKQQSQLLYHAINKDIIPIWGSFPIRPVRRTVVERLTRNRQYGQRQDEQN